MSTFLKSGHISESGINHCTQNKVFADFFINCFKFNLNFKFVFIIKKIRTNFIFANFLVSLYALINLTKIHYHIKN